MAPLPSRLATPGSIIELVHSGDRESLHWRTAPTLTLPDDRLRCSSCFACDETKPMWICNGDEPMRVSPLHSMLVRMPRGTTGTRSEPQCAQPARTSTRVFRSQTSLCRLASTLASESALCEPLHGRVCTRSSIYSIVILSVRVRPCGRHVYSTQCRHFATSHELWESGAYFHKVLCVYSGVLLVPAMI